MKLAYHALLLLLVIHGVVASHSSRPSESLLRMLCSNEASQPASQKKAEYHRLMLVKCTVLIE